VPMQVSAPRVHAPLMKRYTSVAVVSAPASNVSVMPPLLKLAGAVSSKTVSAKDTPSIRGRMQLGGQ
jgi:hypothetical protein